MSGKYFDIRESLYDITERYGEALDLLISIGFENLKDKAQREMLGKAISLEAALKMKKINVDSFVEQLTERIEAGESSSEKSRQADRVKIAGVLPCPVKVPLMESFESWIDENAGSLGIEIDHDLKAASLGVDWLKEALKENQEELLPDLFISAGFDLFFDNELFGKYKEQGVFEDFASLERYNKDLENEYMSLRDPDRQYSMIGVVPAVFLVNKEELGDRTVPRSWKELLEGEFENSVSLPIADFDLFNSILLTIYKEFGEEGVKNLGRILKSSMHPSEMVKSHRKKYEKPTVTIMPYFFTKMIRENDPMLPVWPEDGAIISPIFMLSRKEKKESLKPIVDFLSSKEVGEILSHNGRFPSVNPEVDNMIPDGNRFVWIGWDFIKKNDIGKLIKRCETLFNETAKGGNKQ